MKTKTIPFDLETAKKIQAGEIEGRIRTDEEIIPYEGHENLLGTTDKPKED